MFQNLIADVNCLIKVFGTSTLSQGSFQTKNFVPDVQEGLYVLADLIQLLEVLLLMGCSPFDLDFF